MRRPLATTLASRRQFYSSRKSTYSFRDWGAGPLDPRRESAAEREWIRKARNRIVHHVYLMYILRWIFKNTFAIIFQQRYSLSLRHMMLVFLLDCLRFNALLEILRSIWCNFSVTGFTLCIMVMLKKDLRDLFTIFINFVITKAYLSKALLFVREFYTEKNGRVFFRIYCSQKNRSMLRIGLINVI